MTKIQTIRIFLYAVMLVVSGPVLSDSACTIKKEWTFVGEEGWPLPDKTVKENNCSGSKDDFLAYLRSTVTDDEQWKKYRLSTTVDLNYDGQCDYMVVVMGMGGTGGSFHVLYEKTDAGYQSLGTIVAWGFDYLERHNGHAQLGSGDLSGGDYIKALSRFDGRQYSWYRSDSYSCDEETGNWIFKGKTINEHYSEDNPA